MEVERVEVERGGQGPSMHDDSWWKLLEDVTAAVVAQ